MTASRLLSLLPCCLLWLLPAAAQALCVCGYGDGRFTTDQALTMNGNMDDWAAILADTDNNVCDGGIDNSGTIFQPQPDRDAPVQSTGRDLIHFAYTWNGTAVSTYTERAASDSNVQKFIYYADTDNDGLMETGERMIFATWQGNNRRVELFLGFYVAANPAGDPLVDGSGFADGYKLPGTGTGFPSPGQPTYAGNWGSSDGVKMEWSVPWSALGIAPRSAFTFHVSSTNSTPQSGSFPAQVDDNMGGCGGGPASTQFAALTFTPDLILQGLVGATVYGAHAVTNTGNGSDRFELFSSTASQVSTVSYYRDNDGSGTFTAGDTLLADSGGDGIPDTDAMAPGATLNLLIAYTIANTSAGSAAILTTARSNYDPNITAAVGDTIGVTGPDITLIKAVQTYSDPVHGTISPFAIPGAQMLYTITATNTGPGAADAGSVVITDPIPADTALVVSGTPAAFIDGGTPSGLTFGFGGLADPADSVAFSNDNGASFTYVPTPDAAGVDAAVTHLRINPAGALNASNGVNHPSFQIVFRVRVK